jgi:HrpA-like RNA helicase
MVAGGTGSGKSSQIPQLLLDQLGGAVLVTQPRRLAAVAISQWVAEQRGCRLGSEVGYHIGQQRCASRVTRLLFATCGLSLELLRTNGPAALEPYSVVVLDEVHERSSESDLVLACIRRYMARELPRLKLVLMSATFRADIYREFFADLGGEGERIKLVMATAASRLGTWPARGYLASTSSGQPSAISMTPLTALSSWWSSSGSGC